VADDLEKDQTGRHPGTYRRGTPSPAPETIPGVPGAERSDAKTRKHRHGTKGRRRRWKDSDGNIYEWDSQHGTLEKYNRHGRHLGEVDPTNGHQITPAIPTRRIEP
jgi:hypothetical protein